METPKTPQTRSGTRAGDCHSPASAKAPERKALSGHASSEAVLRSCCRVGGLRVVGVRFLQFWRTGTLFETSSPRVVRMHREELQLQRLASSRHILAWLITLPQKYSIPQAVHLAHSRAPMGRMVSRLVRNAKIPCRFAHRCNYKLPAAGREPLPTMHTLGGKTRS